MVMQLVCDFISAQGFETVLRKQYYETCVCDHVCGIGL